MKNVAVLVGRSSEREISLKTAAGIIAALQSRGYCAYQMEIDAQLPSALQAMPVDVAFIASHGKFGEDGTVQGLLEIMGIPYVGSGVLASALAMNKIMSKKIFEFEHIRTPKWLPVDQYTDLSKISEQVNEIFAGIDHLIVKPASQGSSIGLTLVKERRQLLPALQLALKYDNEVLIEEAISGTELTVAIWGNHELTVSPCIEIVSSNEFYDYEAKYAVNMSKHLIPARIAPAVEEEAKAMAQQAHNALGCRGISRSDFFADKEGRCWLLEVNTLPGMTGTSLVPDAAKALGYSYADLVEKLIQLALEA